jgi:nitric oxide reductase NorE protein
VPGEAGVWVFLFGDLVLFALFFGLYLHYRAQDPVRFLASQRNLKPDIGAVNTLLLLTSSLLVVLAVRAIREGGAKTAPALIAGAFAGGAGFAVLKFFEYRIELTHGLTPATDNFFLCYYLLTGFHLFHLVIGLGVLIFLWSRARLPRLHTRQLALVEGGACFWHLVDLLWIILFPLLYLVR